MFLTVNGYQGGALAKRRAGDEEPPRSQPIYAKTVSSVVSFTTQVRMKTIVVRYTLPKETDVAFRLLDMQGKLLTERTLGMVAAGAHSEPLNMDLRHGQQMCVLIMRAGNTAIRKVLMGKK